MLLPRVWTRVMREFIPFAAIAIAHSVCTYTNFFGTLLSDSHLHVYDWSAAASVPGLVAASSVFGVCGPADDVAVAGIVVVVVLVVGVGGHGSEICRFCKRGSVCT